VDRIQERTSQANRRIALGLKINVASDAPGQIGDLLQLLANEGQNAQTQSNLGLELAKAQGAGDSLAPLSNWATQIAARGKARCKAPIPARRRAIRCRPCLRRVGNISQTQVQGRYIFSGDADRDPCHQLDLTAPDGVDQLLNAASTRVIQNPEGGTFQASMTAQRIFDGQNADGSRAADDVFAALNSLRTALLNNDSAGITAAQSMVSQAPAHLNDAQSFYGNVESQIQNATSYAATHSTELQTRISGIEDADVVSASLKLNEGNTQLQAAFEAQAIIPTAASAIWDRKP
jgi:flagellin-like hook-associated protein FlgL